MTDSGPAPLDADPPHGAGTRTGRNTGQTDADTDADEETDDDADDHEDVEPVEVLVGLAEDGEIDPWDIDIVAVTDRFLERLDSADLRASGRALFYASVLLRMKSEAVMEPETGERPRDQNQGRDQPPARAPGSFAAAPLASGPGDPDHDPFAGLEDEIDRRLERKRARGTPQTLDELVRELREAERENWWKRSREYDMSESERRGGPQTLDYRSGAAIAADEDPTMSQVTANTHGEDVDEIVDEVRAAITDQYDRGRAELLFKEISTVGGSRVQTFLGVLFLAHRGHVRLRQDELFGDLWIQDPAGPAATDSAVAD
jgi:condensin subunit ScpA